MTSSDVLVVARAERLGGAERYLSRLYEGLSRRGVTASLAGRLPGWPLKQAASVEELMLGPKWSRRTMAAGLLRAPSEAVRVARFARGTRFDVAHMQFKREQIAFTTRLSRIMPVIWTEHGVLPAKSPLRPLYARAGRHVEKVICVSQAVAESIEGVIDPAKICVIENGLDVETGPARREGESVRAHIGREPVRVVLWVGRLDSGKRPELAIEYARWNPEDHVLVVGDGTQRGVVERSAIGLSNVSVIGHVDDVGPYYAAADVMMFTSTGRGEGMPTVLVEAAAYGTPVVSHAGSGAEDFVRASGGRVIADATDPEQWRAAISDPTLHDEQPRRQWSDDHNLARWLDRHQAVIGEAASVTRPSSY